MTRDRQANVADQKGRVGRARFNPWLIIVFILLGCVLLLAFEEGLNLAALSLFPHHDTADCAGADTFCSPDAHSGLTGGAVVFLVGNLLAAVAAIAVVAARRRPGRTLAQPAAP